MKKKNMIEMVFFILPSLAYMARDYHWMRDESIGFKQVGGIEHPRSPKGL